MSALGDNKRRSGRRWSKTWRVWACQSYTRAENSFRTSLIWDGQHKTRKWYFPGQPVSYVYVSGLESETKFFRNKLLNSSSMPAPFLRRPNRKFSSEIKRIAINDTCLWNIVLKLDLH